MRERPTNVTPESTKDGVLTLGLDGRILDWDARAAQIFGWTREEAQDQPLTDLVLHPSEQDRMLAALRRFERSNVGIGPLVERLEVRALRKDGDDFPLEVLLTPLPSRLDPILRLFARDVSKERGQEQRKDEFVSMVSHELRTPLTSIRGSLGLLTGGAAGTLPGVAASMIEIAFRNSDRLIRLVNDILDLQKLESGKIRFDLKDLDLQPVLEQAIEATRAFAASLTVHIQYEKLPGAARCRIDPDRVIQVVTNLLSNAAKFSPPGGVIRVSLHRGGGDFEVRITDQGPGIPEEFRSRIFQRFAQAKDSDSRKVSGTGLGLNISKSIVERLNGSIGFETELGKGSTFFFTLPEAFQPQAEASPKPVILHVEDDGLTREEVKRWLENESLVVGAGTLDEATRWVQDHRPDLLILDVSLPDGDGLDLLLPVAERHGSAIPVILYTAGEIPAYLTSLVRASFSKHSTPVGELQEAVRRLLAPAAAPAVPVE